MRPVRRCARRRAPDAVDASPLWCPVRRVARAGRAADAPRRRRRGAGAPAPCLDRVEAGAAAGSSAAPSRCRSTGTDDGADARPRGDPRPGRATPEQRIGSLVFNPGGPGVPAVEFLAQRGVVVARASCATASIWSRSTRAGSARASRSSASTASIRVFDQSFEPATAAARAALVAAVHVAGAAVRDAQRRPARARRRPPTRCATSNSCGSRWGSERSSFVGYSYGTFLGASYADAYPTGCARSCSTARSTRRWSRPQVDARAGTRLRARPRRLPRRLLAAPRAARSTTTATPKARTTRCGPQAGAGTARRPATPTAATLNQTRFDAAVLQQLYLGRVVVVGSRRRARREPRRATRRRCSRCADSFVGRDGDGARRPRARGVLGGDLSRRSGGRRASTPRPSSSARRSRSAPRLGAFIVNNSLPCSVWPVAAGRARHAPRSPPRARPRSWSSARPRTRRRRSAQARALAGALDRGGCSWPRASSTPLRQRQRVRRPRR